MAETRDLETAAQLQRMLLPPSPYQWGGWNAAHHFQPAGAVSGDYLDLVPHADRLYFMLGDVSGKGVAAALLMAQLHAMFRTLIPFDMSLEDLMTRASALLCASSLPAQYATLVCGYLEPDGTAKIVNAGHPAPLAIRASDQVRVEATGMPIGLFCKSEFSSTGLTLAPGDSLLLFSDGLTEATNEQGEEYGIRVQHISALSSSIRPADQVAQVVGDNASFRGNVANSDDLSVLSIRRIHPDDDSDPVRQRSS